MTANFVIMFYYFGIKVKITDVKLGSKCWVKKINGSAIKHFFQRLKSKDLSMKLVVFLFDIGCQVVV